MKQIMELLRKPPQYNKNSRESLDQNYTYWRVRIFSCLYFGYVTYYLTRKSFTFAMPALIDDLGYSKADLGFLASILYCSYGLSKFFSGMLSDRSNPRIFMSIGLILTGVMNFLFAQSASLFWFAIFWGLNGFFQGWGFPPVAKQLTFWFSKKERGLWWSIMSTANNLGGAIIPIIVAFVVAGWGWRWAMYVPASISVTMGSILLIGLRGVPQSLGLPAVEEYRGEKTDASQAEGEEKAKAPGVWDVVLNKGILLLALSFFFVYVIRSGVNDWIALFLHKTKGYSLMEAAASVSWFEVGGFIGSLCSGIISDRFFRGQRIPFVLICALSLIFAFSLFCLLPHASLFLDCLILGIIGFCVFGPQSLIGLASAEFVDKKVACTAYGFTGGVSYLGAAASGYPLGKIIDIWNWQGFFATLIISAFILFLTLLPLYRLQNQRTASQLNSSNRQNSLALNKTNVSEQT